MVVTKKESRGKNMIWSLKGEAGFLCIIIYRTRVSGNA